MPGDENLLKIINYPAPCYPFGMRYHPTHTYTFPYKVQAFAYTDRLHGKSAIYYPDRDKTGVIEITTFKEGSTVAPVRKRFHIDHSTWYESDIGEVVAVDMAFGYDYQRLYILFKQNLSNGKTYRAWLSMYDTNKPSETLFDHSWGIPMYGFIKDMVHLHPFSPENLDTVIDYIKVCGMTGDLIQRPELDQTFNLLCAHDKIFVTLPVMFKPRTMPWDKETEWTVMDARCLYQVLFMFDETAATFNAAAVIGALSTWPEGWETPIPDIFPRQPLKTRMFFMDDCVGWQLAHCRVFPKEWFTGRTTRYNNYHIWYLNGEWDAANMVDHYWQPLTTEAVHIDDLISTLTKEGSTFLKPVSFRTQQYYGQTPLVSDLYYKAASDWSFQRVYGSWDHHIQEYEVKYHNFKRKILEGFEVETIETRTDYPFEKQEFHPLVGVGSNLADHAQTLDLKQGHYRVEMRGADGGPSKYVEGSNPATYPSSGGAGASVSFEFDISSDSQAQIYAGQAGSVRVGGVCGGGNAGTYPADPVDPYVVPSIDGFLVNHGLKFGNPNVTGDCQLLKVPAGYKHIRLVLSNVCPNHCITLVAMNLGGDLLVGAPATRYPSQYTNWVNRDRVRARTPLTPPKDPYWGSSGVTAPWSIPGNEHVYGASYNRGKETYCNAWYPYLYMKCAPTSTYLDPTTMAPDLPPNSNLITEVLKAQFSTTLPSTFSFNDRSVNGTGSEAPYVLPTTSLATPPSPYVLGSLPSYTVGGETIEWSGSVHGSNILWPGRPNGEVWEELYIDEANNDILIGLVGLHQWQMYAEWDPPEPPEPNAEVTGGGGGGFTGFFMNGIPLGIAGAGGGAGITGSDRQASGQANGGSGGGVSGGWGQIGNVDTQDPGTQSTGYGLYKGQDAVADKNASGGGGAGFYGGTANRSTGARLGPGGGGGSSFVLGESGYNTSYAYPDVTISNVKVMPGSGTPGTNPQDGWVTIEGTYYEISHLYKPIYSFLDHELGDFYYQCAGKFITPDRMPVPPAPPPPPDIFVWKDGGCPQPDPIEDPGVPVTPIAYFEYTPPTPPVPDLDIVFLVDTSGSMQPNINGMGPAMASFVAAMNRAGYTTARYALGTYDELGLPMIPISSPKYFTTSGSALQSAFTSITVIYLGGERWAAAILNAHDVLSSEMRYPSGTGGAFIGTYYLMVTDDIHEITGPPGYDTPANFTNVAALIPATDACVCWITTVTGWGSNNLDPTRVPNAAAITTACGGKLLNVMDSTSGTNWGPTAAQAIVDMIGSISGPPVQDDTKYKDWARAFPGLPTLDLSVPAGTTFRKHTAFKLDPPGSEERPVIPGYTVYHTFAIENLACHAYMVDVHLKSRSDKLKLGYLADYDPNKPDPILPPNRDEVSWDEIPPHSEAVFTIYTELEGCNIEDMLEFSYHLELRDD